MSIENAKDFYQKISEDVDFRILFEAASTKEERHQIKTDAGYDFTSDEWQQVLTEIQAANLTQELSQEELESVAGGSGIYTPTVVMGYGVVSPSMYTGIF